MTERLLHCVRNDVARPNGLADMFLRNKAERLTNTALPAFGCAWEKARVRLIEVESNGTD
ncbi:hypothetical protein QRD02_05980 [Aequorivita sp. SDUM287046]|uniref:Uncharacterized protein n=1 Tax=Aequorivita aurantiaca TaxID=3053356 RepID=A0ABT8DL06_9FLAO|nr:hypothetical protein [Aequorivita aurantiaca]MDN3723923.1 hypothetical protein [Aequorivita aurantiaca]